jgi:hypothetical protein
VLPAAGLFIAVKPNLGLAALVGKPSRSMVVGAVVLVVLSLLVMPSWPARWLAVLPLAPSHLVPITTWMGAPLVLCLLRWRRPESRLLLAMAMLPQTATFADQLLLFYVAQSRGEWIALAAMSVVGGVAWTFRLLADGGHPAIVGAPYVLAAIYLPALIVVLRHPNVGTVPAWLEQRVAFLPAILRGKAAA